jgi:hypothetical protein
MEALKNLRVQEEWLPRGKLRKEDIAMLGRMDCGVQF